MQDLNPPLIALVARRYRAMQGLTTMMQSLWLLIYAAMFYTIGPDTTEWWVLPWAGVLLVYIWAQFGWLRRRVDSFYAARFGRTVAPGVWFHLGIMLTMAIGYNQILRDAFHAPAALRVAALLLALCVYPLVIAVRDFPYRSYWLLVAAAGAFAALRAPQFAGRDVYLWAREANLLVGLGLFAAGALDHLMLVRTLGGGTRERVAPEEVEL
jgi:hypothetical protein